MLIISEAQGSQLETVTNDEFVIAEIKFRQEKGKEIPDEKLKAAEAVPIMGIKAQGKPLNYARIKEIQLVPDPDAPKTSEIGV